MWPASSCCRASSWGCAPPIAVKLSLMDLRATGSTVGRIGAWLSLGSIAGAFATGFVLIARLGAKNTIVLVSVLLVLGAIWFLTDAPRRRAWLRAALSLGAFGVGLRLLARGGFLSPKCLTETDCFCI